ncbi:putative GTP-binding protein 6 [Symsagittifera roscoffensis]|uniref:putative GTP-binding protein 6 n=1 Tax=Symsagittifera roscoffensis TaxID=84072 RepID=UPI00307C91C1
MSNAERSCFCTYASVNNYIFPDCQYGKKSPHVKQLLTLQNKRHLSSRANSDEVDDLIDPGVLEMIGAPWDPKLSQKVLLIHLLHPIRKTATTEERDSMEYDEALRLSEAKALVQSVPNWSLHSSLSYYVNKSHFNPNFLFGPQKMADISQFLSKNRIDVIFINTPQITSIQFANLSKLWRRFVIDRYLLVLTIFRLHASSKEAKLQVARLMVSLLKHRVESNCLPWYLTEKVLSSSSAGSLVAGTKRAKGAVTSKEARRLTVQALEAKVKDGLEMANKNRSRLRKRKLESHVPLISVIGYTNCGKTTLIKALTQTDKLTPQNKLFATTEASSHFGQLQRGVSCIYNDTVGFISEMPYSLVDAFTASFEEISAGQLVVHVTDISHRDWKRQVDVVNRTVDEMTNKTAKDLCTGDHSWVKPSLDGESVVLDKQAVIHVFNKSDKLTETELESRLSDDLITGNQSSRVVTSATQLKGVNSLKEAIFSRLLSTGFLREETIVIPNYSNGEYEYLNEHACIAEEIIEEHFSNENEDFIAEDSIRLKIFVNFVVLRKFASLFPENEISQIVLKEIETEKVFSWENIGP